MCGFSVITSDFCLLPQSDQLPRVLLEDSGVGSVGWTEKSALITQHNGRSGGGVMARVSQCDSVPLLIVQYYLSYR